MPDPVVRLDSARLSAAPGGQARVVVTIRNMGQIVEGFRVEVLGEHTGAWAAVHPDEVPVYPQQEATAIVVFTVPDGVGAASGTLPFGVLVRSVVDPDSSAVVEGDLEVAAVFGLQASLSPVTSRGRWRGKHELRVSNWGNAAAHLRLSASDPDERLGFLVSPDVLDVPLGGTARARVLVRIRQPFLRGTPTRLPFQVVADPGPPGVAPPAPMGTANSRVTVDGAVTQVPILSRLVVALATVAVVGVVALAALFVRQGGAGGPALSDQAAPVLPVLQATAVAPDQVRLTWKAVEGVDSYTMVLLDPATQQLTNDQKPVSKSATELVWDSRAPNTSYCFVLQAFRGKVHSQSAPACAKTLPPPTSTASATSGSGGSAGGGAVAGNPAGGPGPTDWVVALKVFVIAADPNAQADATASARALSTQQLPARFLLTSAYPSWKQAPGLTPFPFQQPSFLVYLGPFKTQTDAQNAASSCPPEADVGCLVLLPGPAGAPTAPSTTG